MDRTITALEVQKRNKERVSVYLDGEFAFGLPATEAARLHKGQTLTEGEIAALQQVDAVARAFDHAVMLLARRPYSTAEIRRNLETNETALPIIEEVLSRLERLGYADDHAFAQYWIENREQFRPRGPNALQYELRQKGISQPVIDAALKDFDSRKSAYRAAQDRVRRLRGMKQAEFRNKLGAFLLRRGFGYDIVREVVGQLINELMEEEPDYFAPDQSYEE